MVSRALFSAFSTSSIALPCRGSCIESTKQSTNDLPAPPDVLLVSINHLSRASHLCHQSHGNLPSASTCSFIIQSLDGLKPSNSSLCPIIHNTVSRNSVGKWPAIKTHKWPHTRLAVVSVYFSRGKLVYTVRQVKHYVPCMEACNGSR